MSSKLRSVLLYGVTVEHLGPGDFVEVDCAVADTRHC